MFRVKGYPEVKQQLSLVCVCELLLNSQVLFMGTLVRCGNGKVCTNLKQPITAAKTQHVTYDFCWHWYLVLLYKELAQLIYTYSGQNRPVIFGNIPLTKFWKMF